MNRCCRGGREKGAARAGCGGVIKSDKREERKKGRRRSQERRRIKAGRKGIKDRKGIKWVKD